MNNSVRSVPASAQQPRSLRDRARDFWKRVSEGRQVDDLWSQFAADARATYGLYSREVHWDEFEQTSRWRRPFRIAWELFQAMLMKLSPARRVFLLLALVLLALSGINFQFGRAFSLNINFEFLAAALLFVLLALELADRVAMKRDLEIAREIQGWLVPSAPPQVSGAEIAFATRPQNTVAGDYYDAFFPGEVAGGAGKLLMVIADVAGKSVPAALLMATFQASLRTIASEGASLLEMTARLNRYACAHSLEGRRFTTGVLVEYDPAAKTLQYVNAGHNPPVLRRASGALEFLSNGGVPLGIRMDAEYQSGTLQLQKDDVLVLYTDGVVEAFNEKGQEFGDDRWFAAVRSLPDRPAQEMVHCLIQRVDEYVAGTPQSDDITCLIFRMK